jgi:hypothetical protein
MLKRIKVKVVEKDPFRYMEMSSSFKQKVGGRFSDYHINLGYFIMNFDMYVMILGSYDVVIDMDWLESHDSILNYKTKWLSLNDNEGYRRVIVGRNQGVYLRFVSSLQLQKIMRKGCKIYEILALNDKGEA